MLMPDPDYEELSPIETGLRILSYIRANANLATSYNVPIVVLSGMPDEIFQIRTKDYYAIWCSKPALECDFINAINKSISLANNII